jgi:hypothetical protein
MRAALNESPHKEVILDCISDCNGWTKSFGRFRFNIAHVAAFGYHRAEIYEALWE